MDTWNGKDEMMNQTNYVPVDALRQEVSEALFYTHVRLSQTTNKNLETSAFLYGLIELLNEKGIITTDELDQRKKVVGERLIAQLNEKGLGVMLRDLDARMLCPSRVV